ncbi:MAG TPA: glycogen synthase GlgA [Candidatus Eremiobacteraceae bacterium]|nr:glycogen synthase GlgA [Candidatus Eremiobacteraceae bacterium]
MATPRVLFVTSEMYPLAHTGGLGDVSAALPAALRALGADVRVMLPMYRGVRERAVKHARPVAVPGTDGVFIVAARTPDTDIPVLLVDSPALFDRDGSLYVDGSGADWPDNSIRFAMLSKVASIVASASSPIGWSPQLLHANDWQTGLAVALLATRREGRPPTVFTIHNLTFLGLLPRAAFAELGLPLQAFGIHGVEFYGDVSLMKAGISYADRITTVSPTYAREIQTRDFGAGLDGLLSERSAHLSGILNGADYVRWNPTTDAHIAARYDSMSLDGKRVCKTALQRELKLEERADAFVIGSVSRLTTQKGLDLLMRALPAVLDARTQIVLLGSGDRGLERAWVDAARRHPGQVGVRTGFDEPLSHRIEAGADAFVMPSRFEPCGLNQMYSLRYGTPPIVHRVGGLADTVDDGVTGFSFAEATPAALAKAIKRARTTFADPHAWRAMQLRGMQKDFSWPRSAKLYLEVYSQLLKA